MGNGAEGLWVMVLGIVGNGAEGLWVMVQRDCL